MNENSPSQSLPAVELCWRGGLLWAGPWPAAVAVPHGCRPAPGMPEGWQVADGHRYQALRDLLVAEGVGLHDRVPSAAPLEPAGVGSSVDGSVALAMSAWRGRGHRGQLLGLGDAERAAVVAAAVREVGRAAVVLTPSQAGVDGWQRALTGSLGRLVASLRDPATAAPVTVATWTGFARVLERLGTRFALVVADACDRAPRELVTAVLRSAVAPARLGMLGERPSPDLTLVLSGLVGPVVHWRGSEPVARHVVHLPLNAAEREVYDVAWSRFVGVWDRFRVDRPGVRFREFVHWARSDPVGRSGLLAWHRVQRLVHWTEAKQAAVATLLQDHRAERVLCFTGDRDSAYALARASLVMPVTAELSRAERETVVQDFAAGRLRVLGGPRLLEEMHGLPMADVGIVLGWSFGAAQQQARVQRIRSGGRLYELVAADTVEVSRAGRHGAEPAAT